MMVLKRFHSDVTEKLLKSYTMVVLKSLQRFLNDDTKKVPQ